MESIKNDLKSACLGRKRASTIFFLSLGGIRTGVRDFDSFFAWFGWDSNRQTPSEQG